MSTVSTGNTTGTREAGRRETRTRLLDSAEELFAGRGYFGVGVRDITQHAGTRLASVSDQFGGKEGLFRAVLLRRIQPLNEARRSRLAALPRSGSRQRRLRALVEAFTEPMLDHVENPGWRNYFRFIAQLANSGQHVQLLVADEFNQIATDFIVHLRDVFPAASEPALHDAYLHLLAATLQTFSYNSRLDSLTDGRMHTDDIEQRHRALVLFVEGGITRLVSEPKSG